MPETVMIRLEELIQINSLNELEIAMKAAKNWYDELQKELFA